MTALALRPSPLPSVPCLDNGLERGEMSVPEKHHMRPVMALEYGDLTMLVSDALQREYGGERHAVKRIAAAANSNTRTAKNWLYGVNAPDALNLLRLMAQSPALAGEVRRLTAMQADMDPEFERAFQAAMQLFARRGT